MNPEQAEHTALAIAKSNALAGTLTISTVAHLQRCVGDDFEVSPTGLTLIPGTHLDTGMLTEKIAYFASVAENGNKVRSMINICLGDLLILTREAFGDDAADQIISNAVAVQGQQKHTVQEAERTVKFINELFPEREERPEGLCYSHYSELRQAKNRDGSWAVPQEKFKEIVDKVVEGRVVSSITTGEGEEKTQRAPLSTLETRRLIKEAKPHQEKQVIGTVPQETPVSSQSTETVAAKKPEEKPLLFLYISKEDHTDVVYSTESYLDDDLLTDEYIILDLEFKEVLNPEKEAIAAFTEI